MFTHFLWKWLIVLYSCKCTITILNDFILSVLKSNTVICRKISSSLSSFIYPFLGKFVGFKSTPGLHSTYLIGYNFRRTKVPIIWLDAQNLSVHKFSRQNFVQYDLEKSFSSVLLSAVMRFQGRLIGKGCKFHWNTNVQQQPHWSSEIFYSCKLEEKKIFISLSASNAYSPILSLQKSTCILILFSLVITTTLCTR